MQLSAYSCLNRYAEKPSQRSITFRAKQNSPARKQAYCKPTRTQTFFMSRSADSSTRRTKNEIQIRRIAAMMIEAQNIIQPVYIKPDGDGLPVSFGQRLTQTIVSRLISHLLQSESSLSESTVRCALSISPALRKLLRESLLEPENA